MPDIITTAKGLTSGYVPMGACIISDALIESVSGENAKGSTFSNGYTYSGHPVSAAAALKNIEIFERDGILEHVRSVAPLFLERLHGLRDHPIVSDTRGMGLVGCVECHTGTGDDSIETDRAIGARIDHHCQELGLILRPNINMCVFSPPLIITEQQINQMFDIMDEGIRRAAKDVMNGG